MSEKFDPYETWLGIPLQAQPPNHYRLLGIEAFEDRPAVIEQAYDRRVGNLHAFQAGEHAPIALRLLNEVSVAKICLLNANRKAAYDVGLRQRLRAELAAAIEAQQDEEDDAEGCEQFLQVLAGRSLLTPDELGTLRRMIDDGAGSISASAAAQWLIDQGILTKALAARLLAAAGARFAAPAAGKDSTQRPPLSAAEEEFEFAPLPEDERMVAPGRAYTSRRPASETASESPSADKASAAGVVNLGLVPDLKPLDELLADVEPAATNTENWVLPSRAKRRGLAALFGSSRGHTGRPPRFWQSPWFLVVVGGLVAISILTTILVRSLIR